MVPTVKLVEGGPVTVLASFNQSPVAFEVDCALAGRRAREIAPAPRGPFRCALLPDAASTSSPLPPFGTGNLARCRRSSRADRPPAVMEEKFSVFRRVDRMFDRFPSLYWC